MGDREKKKKKQEEEKPVEVDLKTKPTPPPLNSHSSSSNHNHGQQIEAFNELLLLLSTSLRGASRKQIHDRILSMLRGCTSEELDALLLSADLDVFIKLSKQKTIQVIRERMGELSVRCRAVLLQEFNLARRYKNIFHFNFWAQFVKEVFYSSKGIELTILKNYIDSSGSWRNLFNLVYEDLPIIPAGGDLRNEILQHIKREAKKVRRARQTSRQGRIKIISDLDDTVWCSGGRFPAGCDRKYPAHSNYPGIFALYKEITIGSADPVLSALNSGTSLSPLPDNDMNSNANVLSRYSGNSSTSLVEKSKVKVTCSAHLQEHSMVAADCEVSESIAQAWQVLANKCGRPIYNMNISFGNITKSEEANLQDHSLVMLSARPGVKAAKGFFESIMYRKFVKLKEKGYFHSMPTLLPGSLVAGVRAFVLGAASLVASCASIDNRIVWKSVARKKYKDMVKYMELYPEYDFLFFGDDGQGDVQTAINALKNPKLAVLGSGPRLTDVFIHNVMAKEVLESRPDIHSPTQRFTRSVTELSVANGGMFRLFSTKHEVKLKDQIHYYRNSIEAAIMMYERDYISLNGLYHVSLQSCMDLLRLLRRGAYQHKTWRKEFGPVLIEEYQNSIDSVNTILPNDLQLDDLPDLQSITVNNGLAYSSNHMQRSVLDVS
jgi:hypothetical protein